MKKKLLFVLAFVLMLIGDFWFATEVSCAYPNSDIFIITPLFFFFAYLYGELLFRFVALQRSNLYLSDYLEDIGAYLLFSLFTAGVIYVAKRTIGGEVNPMLIAPFIYIYFRYHLLKRKGR